MPYGSIVKISSYLLKKMITIGAIRDPRNPKVNPFRDPFPNIPSHQIRDIPSTFIFQKACFLGASIIVWNQKCCCTFNTERSFRCNLSINFNIHHAPHNCSQLSLRSKFQQDCAWRTLKAVWRLRFIAMGVYN